MPRSAAAGDAQSQIDRFTTRSASTCQRRGRPMIRTFFYAVGAEALRLPAGLCR
jgi:hypothetical protein